MSRDQVLTLPPYSMWAERKLGVPTTMTTCALVTGQEMHQTVGAIITFANPRIHHQPR